LPFAPAKTALKVLSPKSWLSTDNNPDMKNNPTTDEVAGRMNWLTILRGWAVLLIVIYHVPLSHSTQENTFTIFTSEFNRFFAFRVPLFIFISGFLLHHTRIRRNGGFMPLLKDRFPRILYPYLFITVSLFLIKGLLPGVFKQEIDFSLAGILDIFLYPVRNPLITLWFLNAIFWFYLSYPLIQLSLKKPVYSIVLLAVAIAMHLLVPQNILLLDLSALTRLFVFFYAGVLFSAYHLNSRITPTILMVSVLIWIALFVMKQGGILFASAGIVSSIFLVQKIANYLPKLFGSFSNWYYQIYLTGTIFQIILFETAQKAGLHNYLIILSVLSVLVGIYLPVLMCRLIVKSRIGLLKTLLGFK
jgi:peptidoglycan/LPS O-acetylase OafA/YrhL